MITFSLIYAFIDLNIMWCICFAYLHDVLGRNNYLAQMQVVTSAVERVSSRETLISSKAKVDCICHMSVMYYGNCVLMPSPWSYVKCGMLT